MRFAVFTHVLHQGKRSRYFAYEPYVREMNLWFKQVEEVEVLAPRHLKEEYMVMGLSYQHSNLTFTEIPIFNILNIGGTINSIFRIPIIIFKTIGAMKRADHIHLRCPGNVGLIACFVQIFFPHKPKTAKYAGNWDPKTKQPWSYKLQKWILSNTFVTRNMTVLIYGKWPNQTKNIHPFFTASFSVGDIVRIERKLSLPYKFLFVGNLVPGKQPIFAIELVQALKEKNINAELHFYGDGEMMNSLKSLAGNKEHIHLHGNQPLEILKQAYKESHFLILASKSEGWPKVVAEAMFFGCIPIATAVSCVPWMLGEGSRGILISEREIHDGNPVESGKWKEDSQHVGKREESGLLDTFQKGRQFECFPKSAKAVSENVSRTGFSETPAYRHGRLEVTSATNNEDLDVLDETLERIIELIKDPEEMKRMSREAQEWSQQYTLEKFEAEIKKLLVSKDARP